MNDDFWAQSISQLQQIMQCNGVHLYLDTGRNEIENIENVEQNSVNEPEALAGPKIKRSWLLVIWWSSKVSYKSLKATFFKTFYLSEL